MQGIKKIVNILVMLYLVAAALIYLDILNVGQQTNPAGFYTPFFLAGGLLLLLELIVENLYIMTLKRGQGHTQQKINELKALLYDHKQEIQDLRNRHAEEAAAAASIPKDSPATVPPAYTTATAPITAAPTGTEPVPQVVKPVDPTENPHVIITPKPGVQHPERRRPDNSDT
jgi:hypothetical protein